MEIRPSVIDKAIAIKRILSDLETVKKPCDFVFCVEDSRGMQHDTTFLTIEQQLSEATNAIFTTTIGKRRSASRFYLDSTSELVTLLTLLIPQN